MRKMLLVVFLFFLFPAQFSQAAPAPWGLALNLEKKECAGYWAGDEFTGYALPEGWKAYYPSYESGTGAGEHQGKIRTDAGECSFQMRNEKACCDELGYVFVSDNIGKGQMEKLRDRTVPEQKAVISQAKFFWVLFVILLSAAIVMFFFIRHSLKKRRAKNSEENEHGNNSNK